MGDEGGVISPANIQAAGSAGYHPPREPVEETLIASSGMLKLRNSWPLFFCSFH